PVALLRHDGEPRARPRDARAAVRDRPPGGESRQRQSHARGSGDGSGRGAAADLLERHAPADPRGAHHRGGLRVHHLVRRDRGLDLPRAAFEPHAARPDVPLPRAVPEPDARGLVHASRRAHGRARGWRAPVRSRSRDRSARGTALGALTREHHLLVGEPGTPAVVRDLSSPATAIRSDLVEGPDLTAAVGRGAVEDDLVVPLARDQAVDLVVRRTDRGDIPAVVGGAVIADRRLVVALALPPGAIPHVPRRRHEHVLDGTTLKDPKEVPFTAYRARLAVGGELLGLNVPGADELTKEHERIGVLRVRSGRAEDLFERRVLSPWFGHQRVSRYAEASPGTITNLRMMEYACDRASGGYGIRGRSGASIIDGDRRCDDHQLRSASFGLDRCVLRRQNMDRSSDLRALQDPRTRRSAPGPSGGRCGVPRRDRVPDDASR